MHFVLRYGNKPVETREWSVVWVGNALHKFGGGNTWWCLFGELRRCSLAPLLVCDLQRNDGHTQRWHSKRFWRTLAWSLTQLRFSRKSIRHRLTSVLVPQGQHLLMGELPRIQWNHSAEAQWADEVTWPCFAGWRTCSSIASCTCFSLPGMTLLILRKSLSRSATLFLVRGLLGLWGWRNLLFYPRKADIQLQHPRQHLTRSLKAIRTFFFPQIHHLWLFYTEPRQDWPVSFKHLH